MNQNFSFMEKMVPFIISGRKVLTNRSATEFRGKCNVGDKMYIFTGMRTANCKRIGTGNVIERVFWKYEDMVSIWNRHDPSPLKEMSWGHFVWTDGFDLFMEFKDYFQNHKNRDLGFYCYKFDFSMVRYTQQKLIKEE